MKRNSKFLMLSILILCFFASNAVYAQQTYSEWYYNKFGVYPEGTVKDWEYDPVYHSYLNEQGETVATTKKKKKEYDDRYYPRPVDLYWNGRTAKWSVEGYASKYQVTLYRDGSKVTTKTTESKSMSFSSYMARGEYDYFFRVRAYNKDTGWWSDWEESDVEEIEIRESSGSSGGTVVPSAGPGVVIPSGGPGVMSGGNVVAPQTNGQWIQANGTWHYRYPNGTYAVNTWLKIDNKWYFFDANSNMVTGWLNDGGRMYYLNPDGSMLTGTVIFDGITHFFDSTGVMIY